MGVREVNVSRKKGWIGGVSRYVDRLPAVG